ncbi:MAG TPA: prolyl oligopeptidase family serine peptidase [Clostridia bacterium]|nr:prolyl oligopeptidase family serine peptidase [Clostridia bacterium]
MTVDDLFTIEQFGNAVVSPNGEWIAVVVKRARTKAETYKKDYLWENDHADIWLIPRRGGEPQNVTNGKVDGTGYWNPVWSPDSKKIALMSTKGGDNARLYVWEKDSGKLKRLTEEGVQLEAGALGYGSYNAVVWVSNTEILCPVLAKGELDPSFEADLRTPRIALREWPKAPKGIDATASVLESGIDTPIQRVSGGKLLLLDVTTGIARKLADGTFSNIIPSPQGGRAAVIAEAGSMLPDPKRLLKRVYQRRSRLGIVEFRPTPQFRWIDGVYDPIFPNFHETNPHSWSPDGKTFGVIGKSSPTEVDAGTPFLVTAGTGESQKLSTPGLTVSDLSWTGNGQLVLRASPIHAENEESRFDWWLFNTGNAIAPRNITSIMKTVPTSLFATSDFNTVSGIASGKLWVIDLQTGPRDAVPSLGDVKTIAWPDEQYLRCNIVKDIVVVAGSNEFYRVDLSNPSGRATSFVRPSTEATLLQYSLLNDIAVFKAEESEGSFVWTADSGGKQFERRMALNEHLKDIANSERLLIEYRANDGQDSKALLLLPVGYKKGEKYPLIAWVYAGSIQRSIKGWSKSSPTSLNLNLLTSHGYAVLIPSMPLQPTGQGSDPFMDIPKGVLPAVDKVVELGIADPERLGVMGQSYGGYSTYALVTQTTRFKAAITLAGYSDLFSLYSQFEARDRYSERPHENLFMELMSETQQTRMGTHPWDNLWRYLRNSPVFFLDRVQTPLMIIQGDMDYVSIGQGEEFFSGMYRLNKRARFVRYWGEGHTIESPANIRDMWQRVFSWFDEFLKPGSSSPVLKSSKNF